VRASAWRWLPLAAIAVLAGCQSVGYVAHVAHGHAELLAAREDIDTLVADPSTPESLRRDLTVLREARRFAVATLGLPDNRSYTRFVQLDRPVVTWAVFAAPEFSVDPLLHCFPIAGCVPYKGYFRRELAEREAARLQRDGLQTHIGGVGAYSTLGWFADPLLSTMLEPGLDAAVSTLFHELAHQRAYAPGDAAFNESYAVFVEAEGMRAWRQLQGWPAPDAAAAGRARAFTSSVLALRERLARLYASGLDPARMRAVVQAEHIAFRAAHRRLRQTPEWAADRRFDGVVDGPLDNARLVPFGLYDGHVAAFRGLFHQLDGDWERFHAAVEALAALPRDQRWERLLAHDADAGPVSGR